MNIYSSLQINFKNQTIFFVFFLMDLDNDHIKAVVADEIVYKEYYQEIIYELFLMAPFYQYLHRDVF